jgi:hypothetical protein
LTSNVCITVSTSSLPQPGHRIVAFARSLIRMISANTFLQA